MKTEEGEREIAVSPTDSQQTNFREPILGHHELEGVQKALAHSVHEFLPLVTPQALSTHHLGPEPTGESSTPRKVSDDDEIDYSVKPEFYDPDLDEKDELWVQRKRKGRFSDAVLSCPACFTTLCLECQRHEKYLTQYRAIFVVNCKIKSDQVSQQGSLKRKRGKRGRESGESEAASAGGETFRPVCCSVCATEVGVIDEDEVYHFFNVLPSEC